MNVFISYSSKEYDKANSLKQVLDANGIACWMAPKSIPSGSDYSKEIPKAIKSCDIFLLLLSEASQSSRWVPKELDNAINEGKIIIPFHIDDSILNDAFNFMLSNVQRIEAFNRLSEAYKQLVMYIKSLSGDKNFDNVIIRNEVKLNMCPIAFNTIPGNTYIAAKETRNDIPYRPGPIIINHEEAYWVLTTINNMCPDDKAIAKNVRLSMSIKKVSDFESVIESTIICPNAEPNVSKHSIKFSCDVPFELEYFEQSAYMYSEYYGLHSSRQMALTDEIMTERGTLIGFWKIDGQIPGGLHNSVTVSIQIRVVRKNISNNPTENKNDSINEKKQNDVRPNVNSVGTNNLLSHGNTKVQYIGSPLSGIYLGHSGFFIESESASMIFDWSEGDLPEIDSKKPLYIFISHVHNDHFNRDVFKLVDKYPHVEIFLGYDNNYPELNDYFDQLPDKVTDVLSRFSGEQKLFSDDGKMEINTLRSTDEGVAFIVNIDGKTLYHAGDLFLMQIMDRGKFLQMSSMAILSGSYIGSYEDYLEKSRREFIEYTEPLRGKTIDYAMIPLDPRVYTVAEETIKRYMDVATIKSWSPMHLWGKYEFVDEFLGKHPEYADTMIGTSKSPRVKWHISLGERYDI